MRKKNRKIHVDKGLTNRLAKLVPFSIIVTVVGIIVTWIVGGFDFVVILDYGMALIVFLFVCAMASADIEIIEGKQRDQLQKMEDIRRDCEYLLNNIIRGSESEIRKEFSNRTILVKTVNGQHVEYKAHIAYEDIMKLRRDSLIAIASSNKDFEEMRVSKCYSFLAKIFLYKSNYSKKFQNCMDAILTVKDDASRNLHLLG